MDELEKPFLSPESIDSIAHQLEVVSRAIDTIPARSAIGQYLAEPAKEEHKDQFGRTVFKDADYTLLDQLKTDTAKALDEFRSGQIGTVRLLSGMVNGYHDAHEGTGIRNMRYAFGYLNHFNITGSSDFHKMLNPSGEKVGKLIPGYDEDVRGQNTPELARGAVHILNGANTVMFDGYNDKPSTKMYGLRDPKTGEILPNTFMLVMSGSFSDKEGTSSNFSNIASARIVLIPEAAIEAARQPEAIAQSTFDIDKVDWKLFEGDFKVRRTGGQIDKHGWKIKEVFEQDGVYKAKITSWNKQDGAIQKTISVEDLVTWQAEQPE